MAEWIIYLNKMKKIIVTTTINEPTEATLKFCEKKDWQFIIAGDKKTPHNLYRELEKKYSNVFYYSPEEQEKDYPVLSDALGWNCIQRRILGLVKAYHMGAEIIATVDDDNIPYENWGKGLYIGKEVECYCYKSSSGVFDPLSITKSNFLWHRGYPIELLQKRKEITPIGKVKRKVLVQANLWDGDPDIDAMARLSFRPEVKFDEIVEPYCSEDISPFNSQNTFLSREVLPFYCLFPFVGRMDDIWGSYVLQKFFPNSVVYGPATVYQDRNVQDLVKNLEAEIIGYRRTFELINDLNNFQDYLPPETRNFWHIYREIFTNEK